MRSRLAMLAAVALFAISAAQARVAGLTVAGMELVEKTHEAEIRMSVAKDSATRVGVLKELITYLAETEEKLPPKNADDEMRNFRASLWSLKGYLGKIDTQAFDPKKCPQYRTLILMGFSPHGGSPSYVPGEAKEALKILSIVCEKPGLAEVPGSKQEPPPKARSTN